VSPSEPSPHPLAEPTTPHPSHNPGSWISHWATLAGDRAAVHFADQETSYRAFEDRVARLAQRFIEQGVDAGDRIAILLDNHPAYLEAIFAGARIGAITLPINTRLAPAELAFLLEDATPRLVMVDERSAALLDQVQGLPQGSEPGRIVVPANQDSWNAELDAYEGFSENLAVRADDPMLLMYTSGTTGAPKGALLPHRKALHNSLNAEDCFAIDGEDRCLVVAPLFHSLGLHILSLPVFHAGACVVLQSGFDAEEVLDSIATRHITYMGGVPTHYERMLATLDRHPPDRFDLNSLKFLFGAGAAVSPHTIRAFAERGVVLKQGYGQTETSMLCCLEEADALRKAGSVGRPLGHMELRVVDRTSLQRPSSEWRNVSATTEDEADEDTSGIGEIVVRGPITMLGYWRQDTATRETLRDGWVLTGDLARIDSEGFIYLVGRSREMFISGGENVYPAEIEAAYLKHPAVAEIAVKGTPHQQWGEVGCAFVVSAPGVTCDPEALRDWGQGVLAKFKIPHVFQIVDELPKTASGKIQKHLLG
jgi:fatty-acyl-CoA synthase